MPMTARRSRPNRKRPSSARRNSRSPKTGTWSGEVTRKSNALDLQPGVFTFSSPRRIALSLKRSAEQSTRRKTDPFRSAMSMLNFYINRAGRQLSAERRRTLNEAKIELRKAFGRAESR